MKSGCLEMTLLIIVISQLKIKKSSFLIQGKSSEQFEEVNQNNKIYKKGIKHYKSAINRSQEIYLLPQFSDFTNSISNSSHGIVNFVNCITSSQAKSKR